MSLSAGLPPASVSVPLSLPPLCRCLVLSHMQHVHICIHTYIHAYIRVHRYVYIYTNIMMLCFRLNTRRLDALIPRDLTQDNASTHQSRTIVLSPAYNPLIVHVPTRRKSFPMPTCFNPSRQNGRVEFCIRPVYPYTCQHIKSCC